MEGYLFTSIFCQFIIKRNRRILLCVFISIFLLPQLYSQEHLLIGKLYNKITREALSFASVIDKASSKGTFTNDSGVFQISLPYGKHNIEFSHTSFERLDTIISLTENMEISIYMNPSTIRIGEVTITATGVKDHVSSSLMGSFTLTNIEMTKLPSLLGETDPLKLLQLTPGVQAGSEGNIGFYVRGGGTDQNLILYDNTLVYNPGHLLGFFSVFNPDIIKDVSIIKSGIPAKYGGKLSSVINLTSYKGNPDSLEVKGSVGIISSRISIGGPFFQNKGTFIIGARRTYLELFVEPLVRRFVNNKAFFHKKSTYNFFDLNAGATIKISETDNILFSGYFGKDNFNMARGGIKQENSLKWGNSMATLSWNHKFNENIEGNTNISLTKYEFNLSGSQADYFFGLLSSVNDYSLKGGFSFTKSSNKLSTGYELISHRFVPNRIDAKAGNIVLNFGQFSDMNALEGAIYVDDEVPLSSRITLAGGFRLSFFNHRGPFKKVTKSTLGEITDTLFYPKGKSLASFFNPEPRLVLKYEINPNTSVKASYMRVAQYIHLATSASASLPTDIWIPSTSELKPLIGDQFSLGYFRNFPIADLEFSTETYYKKMRNQLEFLRGVINNSVEGTLADNIAVGYGQSYGIEFYIKKKIGNSTGWLSYTLSRTEQKFNVINAGYIYPAKYDRRHDISFTFLTKFNEKWSGSAVFIYISGNAFTMPVGRYIIQGNVVNQYGDINSFRMPPYHRMDISFTRKIVTRKNWSSELIFSIYNVYSRANPYFIYFEASGDLEKYSLEVKPVVVSLFPVIPSISWSFKF